jgi:histidinol dehydrogenase
LIVADQYADPFTIATDLISQAEHGPDSPAVLITTSESVGGKAMEIVEKSLGDETLSTAALAKTSWDAFGEVVVVGGLEEAWSLADEYSFEHVQIFTQDPREALTKMRNYGALFLGEKTCVSYGDKVFTATFLMS